MIECIYIFSCSQVMYQLGGNSMNLKELSVVVKFVPSTHPAEDGKRFRFLKPKAILSELPEDSEDIFDDGILEHYQRRPTDVESLTLADFVTGYDRSQKGRPSSDSAIRCGNVNFRKRTTPAVLRTYRPSGPNLSPEAEISRKVSFLVLYHPWRNPTDIPPSDDTDAILHLFNTSRELILAQIESHEPYGIKLDQAVADEDPEDPVSSCSEEDTSERNRDEAYQDQVDIGRDVYDSEGGANVVVDVDQHKFIITDEAFTALLEKLNEDQARIVDEVRQQARNIYAATEEIAARPKPIQWFLTGGAGVGKSFVIHVIRNLVQRELHLMDFPKRVGCLVTATTGCAAFAIQGATLHTTFHLPLTVGTYQSMEPLSQAKVEEVRESFLGVEFLIIDEVSMLGYPGLVAVHQRLQQIRDCEDWFGGVNVICVGDMFQLPPVMQTPVYGQLRGLAGMKQLAVHLWKDLFEIRELREIMRQQNGSAFAEALNRLRLGESTEDDLRLFRSRIVNSAPPDCLRLFRTNAACDAYNTEMLSKTRGVAYEIVAKTTPGITITDVQAGGVREVLTLKTGCRIMIVRNVDIERGIVNGATGTLVKILTKCRYDAQTTVECLSSDVMYVSIALDDSDQTVQVSPLSVKFMVRGKTVTRLQLPLVLGFGCTIHKAQGKSLSTVAVDLRQPGTAKLPPTPGLVYVALSRAKSLDGLHIIGGLTEDLISTSCRARAEMARLREAVSTHESPPSQ